jgi:hypothetical protein
MVKCKIGKTLMYLLMFELMSLVDVAIIRSLDK